MDDEPMNEKMESYPVQIYESSERVQPDNKDNVVLRSLPGNPNRHIPLAEDRSPSTTLEQKIQPTSMYSLETRYQPIPPKVLPNKTDPAVYYINSKPIEESPIITRDRESPLPIQSEVPIIFLQPQVVSQPVLYSVAGKKPTPISEQPPSPTVYSITGRPRTVDMSINSVPIPTPVIDKSPTLYSWVGNSNLQNEIPEPTKQLLQPSPKVYSIVGSPARTSRGTQATAPSPIQPTPILYTIVGDTPPSTNKPPPPLDTVRYTLDNESNAHKTQQPIPKSTLYALVGKPNSPPLQEHRSKPPPRTKTPPPLPIIVNNRRKSHSVEKRPETITEEIVSYPKKQPKRQPHPKEPIIPKSELIIIPFNEEEHRPRRQPPLIYTTPEQPHRKPHTITQHQPLQLSDYHSPYANRTYKPYREQKYTHTPLPVVSNNHLEKKERPPLYEPRYRVERHHPYVGSNPTILERPPVNTKSRSSLWDNGYLTQTDDDEEYEQRINKKKKSYRTPRTRTPWIPVW